MAALPSHIQQKLKQAESLGLYRKIRFQKAGIDFSSNNYLGLPPSDISDSMYGSGGSRLITGTQEAHLALEEFAANTFQKSALLYNSGYAANLGVLQALPQRQDLILYDEAVHASMRDGMLLSKATNYSFEHNQVEKLEAKLKQHRGRYTEVYILCESLYSMSGKMAPLDEYLRLAELYNAWLIVDEAHGAGWQPEQAAWKRNSRLLARILALGKAYNTVGALVLAEPKLKEYLINFSRSFIYTTALPAAIAKHILQNIALVSASEEQRNQLEKNISFWCKNAGERVTTNAGPIQFIYLPLEKHTEAAEMFAEKDLDVRSIRYPTVKKGQEGFRVVLHSFNSQDEIALLKDCIQKL